MSWGLYSTRVFDQTSKNTTKEIGPGTYETEIKFGGNLKQMSVPFGSSNNEKKITKYDVYKVGLYNASIAAEILGINKKNIVKMDRDLPIRKKEDIDISVTEILDLLNKEPGSFIKDIYSNIEYLILYSKLKNSNDKLREYIINNY